MFQGDLAPDDKGLSRGFSTRSVATLASYGLVKPSNLELQLFQWPIPVGLSTSLNTKPSHIIVTRDSTNDPFGFSLNGVEEDETSRGFYSNTGTFIAEVAPRSPASRAGLVTAMRINSMNGSKPTSKADAERIMEHTGFNLDMEVEYDPRGFQKYDYGTELRRISMYAFQGKWTSDVVELAGLKYYGNLALADSVDSARLSLKDVDELVSTQLKSKKSQTVQVGLTPSVMLVAYEDTEDEGRKNRLTHRLMDATAMRVVSKGLGIVVIEDTEDPEFVMLNF